MILILQETCKSYVTQRFRNQRRGSEPASSSAGASTGKKLVTAAHAVVTAQHGSASDEIAFAEIAYKRNSKALVQEYRSRHSNPEHIQQLMKATYDVRRSKITTSLSHVVTLKTEYPFFGCKDWVCT